MIKSRAREATQVRLAIQYRMRSCDKPSTTQIILVPAATFRETESFAQFMNPDMYVNTYLIPWLLVAAISIPSPSYASSSIPVSLGLRNTTHASNSSSAQDAISFGVWPLDVHYYIPDSPIDLRLHFGFPRHALDLGHLTSLFRVVRDIAAEGTQDHGPDTVYPREPDGTQIFSFSLGDGVDIVVKSHEGSLMSWGELSDILRGLELYLVAGKRPYQTVFSAGVGPVGFAIGKVGEAEPELDQS